MIAEAFGHNGGTALGVQARIIANITLLAIADIRLFQSNLGPQQVGDMDILVDGDQYTLHFTFTDDAIDQRTLHGYEKEANPESRSK